MKRVILSIAVIAALGLTSCKNETKKETETTTTTEMSKVMAMTMLDLYENPKLVEKVKTEYLERKGTEVYEAIVPDGPPPIPSK